MGQRLDQLEKVLSEREWLAADRFTAADLLMADVLRVSDGPLLRRPAGDRSLREAGNGPPLIQESPCRSDCAFRGGRRKENG